MAGALPQLHLKKPVLRDDKALRKEKVVLVLSKDVCNAPVIPLHADFTAQPR